MKVEEMERLANLNPFTSVVHSFPVYEGDGLLLGVKNDFHIHSSFIQSLVDSRNYQLHTIDVMAKGGRAIDLQLMNPITGNYMSGSSSGTAINVFLGMNDIGIGSDGGGSVLAPAMSLNLFGFISYLIDKENMNLSSKVSTDLIRFRPSLGYIAKDFNVLKDIIKVTLPLEEGSSVHKIVISSTDTSIYPFEVESIKFPDIYGDRKENIHFLEQVLPTIDFLISKEGPVDVDGFGDSVFGHFDERTKQIQRKAQKGLLRVANMVGATAISIPTNELGVSYLGICESVPSKIQFMIGKMEQLVIPQGELIERYFRDPATWFRKGYGEEI